MRRAQWGPLGGVCVVGIWLVAAAAGRAAEGAAAQSGQPESVKAKADRSDAGAALSSDPMRSMPSDNWGLGVDALDTLGMEDLCAAADVKQRLTELTAAAGGGDALAMLLVGYAHDLGLGVREDKAAAREWFRRAAESGLPRGMNAYGWALIEAAEGADLAAALAWSQRAVEAGNGQALATMGFLHQNGLAGGPVDEAAARSWYERAAERGNRAGMLSLAVMLLEGEGGPADPKAGVAWLTRLAEGGDTDGMAWLALVYRKGKGVSVDYARARFWSERAAAAGHPEEMYNLALMLLIGEGGPSDRDLAAHWARRASAEAGANEDLRRMTRSLLRGLGEIDS